MFTRLGTPRHPPAVAIVPIQKGIAEMTCIRLSTGLGRANLRLRQVRERNAQKPSTVLERRKRMMRNGPK